VIVAEFAVLGSNLSWPIIVGIAAIIAAGYGAIAGAMRRWLLLDVGLNRLQDVLLLLAAGIVGAALVALLLSLLLIADHQLDLADVFVASAPLLVGDILGIAVMTPLILRLALREPPMSRRDLRALAPDVALYVAVVTLSLWIIVGTESADGFKYFYLFFLPVVVAAVRYGLDGACLGLALTQFGLVGLMHWHGYDANVFTEFQVLMLVLTATGLTVGVVVTERRQANRAMRDAEARLAAKEAEAAHAARFHLVSGMASALAHEINQPMTAARALARAAQEILRGPGGDHARADANLATLIAQIDHAGSVVRRMREFLRRGRPHTSTIDVQGMLDDVLDLARMDPALNGTRLDLAVDDPLPMIHADRIQIQQVLLNLIRNAVDSIAASGRDDGRILITIRRLGDPDRIEFAILDNGTGIDDTVAGRLFEPLTTSKQEGLGLGLSISASIVESHGGRIWVQSPSAGATEFRFWLPLDANRSDRP
jgi:signal transduction histidine kinase